MHQCVQKKSWTEFERKVKESEVFHTHVCTCKCVCVLAIIVHKLQLCVRALHEVSGN